MSVNDLLEELGSRAEEELTTPVRIIDKEDFPSESDLYLEKRIWIRLDNAVAVVADLKGSTLLDFRKNADTSARLYEALTGNMVRIVEYFDPAFVDIQGDGLFALYHGDGRYERAFCAAVTLKTFSERWLVPMIEKTMSSRFPKTGLKVGMHGGRLVVKRVGVRGTSEPVWAGKPVNWASKCAQHADRHELIVTETVYNRFRNNQWVTHSCGCVNGEPGGAPLPLWTDATVSKLPEEHARCHLLRSMWCENCGDEFCQAILDGETKRSDIQRAS